MCHAPRRATIVPASITRTHAHRHTATQPALTTLNRTFWQPSSSGQLLLLLLPVLLLIAVVARWPRSASNLIQYVTGEARRANPRDDYVNIPLSPLHRQMLHHSAMRAPAVDADCGAGDPLLERMPSRTPSRRWGRVA